MAPRIGERVGAVALGFFVAAAANAQIITDGTVGPAGPLAGPNYAIGANLGSQVGGNLFHSFSQFNVNTGQSATFSGPNDVTNIVSRVTGSSSSNINGLLSSTIPGANLFLINPRGVVFGANAQVDVPGSFHVTTADYLKLGNDGSFHARNPGMSTLTSSPPSAFGFLGTATPGSISLNNSFLAFPVPVGQSFSLIGGNVTLNNSFLFAPGTRVDLASAAGAGEVALAADGISAGPAQVFGQVLVSNSVIFTGTDASYDSGPIFIRGGRIVVDRTSFISSGPQAGSTGAGAPITLHASEAVEITGNDADGFQSTVTTITSGAGRAGDIRVIAPRVTIDDGGQVFSGGNVGSSGAAGAIEVDAARVELLRGGSLSSPGLGSGDGAPITVRATESVLIQGADDVIGLTSSLNTFTLPGAGSAGDITVVTPRLTVDGGTLFAETSSSGGAGNILLDVGRLEVLNGGFVQNGAAEGSTGAGGSLVIRASESVLIQGFDAQGSFSSVSSFTAGAGRAGDISVTTPLLTLRDGFLGSPTLGAGNAGAVSIDVARLEVLAGGQINSTVQENATGAGGVVTIRASDSILVQGHDANGKASTISVAAFGPGAAGNIAISTPFLDLQGGLIRTVTETTGSGGSIDVSAGSVRLVQGAAMQSDTQGPGAGGNITITAGSLSLADASVISAQSTGTGMAGNISIDAGSSLKLAGGGAITTAASSADGGDIQIRATDIVHLIDSRITTAVGTGSGNGGNITIDPVFVILQNSQIIANAFGGNGGNISIVSQFFLSDPQSLVQASSQLGISGSVLISAPQIDLSSSVTVLPSAFFDASGLLRESCAARAGRSNSFVPAGRGGLAAQPERAGFSDYAATSAAPLSESPPLWLARSGCPS